MLVLKGKLYELTVDTVDVAHTERGLHVHHLHWFGVRLKKEKKFALLVLLTHAHTPLYTHTAIHTRTHKFVPDIVSHHYGLKRQAGNLHHQRLSRQEFTTSFEKLSVCFVITGSIHNIILYLHI